MNEFFSGLFEVNLVNEEQGFFTHMRSVFYDLWPTN